jgi:restriction system protein
LNLKAATLEILRRVGKPLHAKEIAKRIIDAGLWQSEGKTPEASVSARLYSDSSSL